jgi:hypothetical protein
MSDQKVGSTLELLGSNGERRTVTPFPTFKSGIHGAEDPLWHVADANTTEEKKMEWLDYLTTDGTRWEAKIRCSYDGLGNSIRCRFEHKNMATGTTHDDSVMGFWDWDRRGWTAEHVQRIETWPAPPLFVVTPV